MELKYKGLRQILKLSQEDLKEYCCQYMNYLNIKYENRDGYIYAKGDIPIMLVAHLDTVHREQPKEIYYDEQQNVMWSPQGIGGDDRCGVYAILKLLKYYRPYIAFVEDEEIGSVGASKMIKNIEKPDVNFIVEIDRRGKDDCVFYDCGNKEFQQYIEKFGFKLNYGSFTDICVLSDAWDVASVNLSSGYFKEHTTNETINTEYLQKTIMRVAKILEDKDSKYYDYQSVYVKPKEIKKINYKYYDEWGYVDEDGIYHYWEEYYDCY